MPATISCQQLFIICIGWFQIINLTSCSSAIVLVERAPIKRAFLVLTSREAKELASSSYEYSQNDNSEQNQPWVRVPLNQNAQIIGDDDGHVLVDESMFRRQPVDGQGTRTAAKIPAVSASTVDQSAITRDRRGPGQKEDILSNLIHSNSAQKKKKRVGKNSHPINRPKYPSINTTDYIYIGLITGTTGVTLIGLAVALVWLKKVRATYKSAEPMDYEFSSEYADANYSPYKLGLGPPKDPFTGPDANLKNYSFPESLNIPDLPERESVGGGLRPPMGRPRGASFLCVVENKVTSWQDRRYSEQPQIIVHDNGGLSLAPSLESPEDEEGESTEDNTVWPIYECPGLAPTNNVEVCNPMFKSSSMSENINLCVTSATPTAPGTSNEPTSSGAVGSLGVPSDSGRRISAPPQLIIHHLNVANQQKAEEKKRRKEEREKKRMEKKAREQRKKDKEAKDAEQK